MSTAALSPPTGESPLGASFERVWHGQRTRILVAAVFSGMAALYILWFGAALRTALATAGLEGWGAAATAASGTLGALFLLLISVSAILAYSIAGSGNAALVSGLNDFEWAVTVLTSFPRAMCRTGSHRLDKGGHLAAWEQPELLSNELRATFNSLR